MKRFQFRLERLLEIRRHEEHQEEIRLASAAGECRRLSRSIGDKRDKVRREILERQLPPGPLQTDLLQTSERYSQRLQQESRREQADLVQKKRERDEVKKDYLKASKKKKVLEKLRERKEEEYYTEQQRKEIQMIDEINNAEAARRINALAGGKEVFHGE